MRENDPVKFLPVIVYRLEEKGDTVHLDTQSVDQTRDPNSQVNTNPVSHNGPVPFCADNRTTPTDVCTENFLLVVKPQKCTYSFTWKCLMHLI